MVPTHINRVIPICTVISFIYLFIYFSDFSNLLPALVGPSTCIELFHYLLDLPLLGAAMEKVEMEKGTCIFTF